MSKVHWKKSFHPNYFGTDALPDGNDVVLTIGKVAPETVTGTDGQKEECLVCHWQEPGIKPLILNKSNCRTISKICKSPYVEDWEGHRIQLGSELVKAFGEMVDAIRVRKNPPEDVHIFCDECGQELTPSNGMTVSQLAAYSKKRFDGKVFCVECGKDAAKKMKESGESETDK
jgi:hypothetical protein